MIDVFEWARFCDVYAQQEKTFLGHQNFIKLYSEIFPKSVLILGMAMMNQLICTVYGREGLVFSLRSTVIT